MAIRIYHNQRCMKSRLGLALLEEKGVTPEIIYYMKDGVDKQDLSETIQKLGIKPTDLLRKNEAIFKEEYKGKDLSDEEWIDAMVKHPKLIERPIVINGNKAVIGRPTERILEVL